MGAREFESTLARLYVDQGFRQLFLADPGTALKNLGLTPEEQQALTGIDRVGLIMAADSYQSKRTKQARNRPPTTLGLWDRCLGFWRNVTWRPAQVRAKAFPPDQK